MRGEHSPEAESLLSKAVKLDPAMVEAWNELGEAHWKRGDIDTAKTCFEGAVRLVRPRPDLICTFHSSLYLLMCMLCRKGTKGVCGPSPL